MSDYALAHKTTCGFAQAIAFNIKRKKKSGHVQFHMFSEQMLVVKENFPISEKAFSLGAYTRTYRWGYIWEYLTVFSTYSGFSLNSNLAQSPPNLDTIRKKPNP